MIANGLRQYLPGYDGSSSEAAVTGCDGEKVNPRGHISTYLSCATLTPLSSVNPQLICSLELPDLARPSVQREQAFSKAWAPVQRL